jgi:hypothetical protein
MDLARLGLGEKVAGISGALLILFMFVFAWFGIKLGPPVVLIPNEQLRSAWDSYGFVKVVLLVTGLVGVALAVLAASGRDARLLNAASAVVAGLGLASVALIVISIINPPDFVSGVEGSGPGFEQTRKIGVWLGLIAAIGVAAGGYTATHKQEAAGGPAP